MGRIRKLYLLAILWGATTTVTLSQTDSTQRTWKWEITADYGATLAGPYIEKEYWEGLYSVRFGAGIIPLTGFQTRLFIIYHRLRSSIRWGGKDARVFDNMYPRSDVAMYVQFTSGWFSLAMGAYRQFREDMPYHEIKAFVSKQDSALYVLKSPTSVNFFLGFGIGPSIPLGSDFYIPMSIYLFEFGRPMISFRLGLSKRF